MSNFNIDLFQRIVDKENVYKAYKKALKGRGKFHPEAIRFSMDETSNILELIDSLITEEYEFDGYIRFPVFEPKERIVDAPHFKDKVVQLAINNILKEVYNPCFIFDSYACIDGRGTHKCVDRIQYFIRKAKWQYGEDAVILKMDIKKFFYNIDRDILKKILCKKIKCKKTLRLIFKIVDSADAISELGLPLGNTLSQICANIYLNEVDQFIKRKLGVKYFVRYMDDFVLVLPNKDICSGIFGKVKEFLKKILHLELNIKKSKMFPVAQGVNAVGFKIYATHRLLRNDSKKKIKRKIRAFPNLVACGKILVSKAEQMINSWLGHARHASSYNFIQSLLSRFEYVTLNAKSVLKLDNTLLLPTFVV